MIKCLLTELGPRSVLEPNIFPSGPPTQPISTYCLIIPGSAPQQLSWCELANQR